MERLLQNGGYAGHIMVFCKIIQMPAGIQTPGFRAELTVEGISDLKQVATVKAGV